MRRGIPERASALVSATVVLALTATVGWSQSLTWLGTLGGYRSAARGVSADGAVVVGYTYNASYQWRAFRWTPATGMQDLGTLGGYMSEAFGVSADGAVVVGGANTDEIYIYPLHAFRWTQATGMQYLGTLGGIGGSEAYGVSADGAVVVGRASRDQNRAFRWTPATGMQDLGTLPGGGASWAYGVSADGAVVVGWSDGRAFRWTLNGGMEDLNQTYASLLTGGYLIEARAISPDGRYIVGNGFHAATGRTKAFLLDTWHTGDTNGDGCINDADLLNVLSAFGTPGTGYTRHEDINKDGIVDDADLLTVLFNFGSGC